MKKITFNAPLNHKAHNYTPQTGNVLPNLNLAIPTILALVSILAAVMLKKKETDE